MKIAIVIVNYRAAELVIQCLKSIASELSNSIDIKVYIVDEHSQDHSVRLISDEVSKNDWRRWVFLLVESVNKGFAHGNNVAIRNILSQDAKPDFILLLNPDTIVLRNSISILAEFLSTNPSVGIVGSQLYDREGGLQIAAFQFPSIIGELEQGLKLGFATKMLSRWSVIRPPPDRPTRVDWVAGTCMMVRANVFDKVGLLDEDYFLYYEEVDYMLRASRRNIQVWTIPASKIVHIGGQSTGVIDGASRDGTKPLYIYNSRYLYFTKNYGFVYYWVANLFLVIGSILNIIRLVIMRRPTKKIVSDMSQLFLFSFSGPDRPDTR